MNQLGLALISAAALLSASAVPANAQVTATFNSNGDTFSSEFLAISDASGTVVPNVTAFVEFELTGGLGTNTLTFDYSIENTTSAPAVSTITSFGFNVQPNFTTAAVDGQFNTVSSGNNIPNGVGVVEFCGFNLPGNCTGSNPGGGITTGNTGTGTFTLNYTTAPTAVTLSSMFLRFQAIVGSTVGSATGIPVPAPLAGAGVPALLALVGLVWYRRRNQVVASKATPSE